MNDFEFLLEDIIFNKKVKITENECYDISLALLCASDMFNETGRIEDRRKSREFLKLRDKIKRC